MGENAAEVYAFHNDRKCMLFRIVVQNFIIEEEECIPGSLK
jgi:hypothetical protein